MASAVVTGRTRPTKLKKQMRAQKRKRADVDVEQLQQAVDAMVSFYRSRYFVHCAQLKRSCAN